MVRPEPRQKMKNRLEKNRAVPKWEVGNSELLRFYLRTITSGSVVRTSAGGIRTYFAAKVELAGWWAVFSSYSTTGRSRGKSIRRENALMRHGEICSVGIFRLLLSRYAPSESLKMTA